MDTCHIIVIFHKECSLLTNFQNSPKHPLIPHQNRNPVGVPTFEDRSMKIQHIPNNWLEWDTIVVPQYQIYPNCASYSGTFGAMGIYTATGTF
jgi:hypothetical protein